MTKGVNNEFKNGVLFLMTDKATVEFISVLILSIWLVIK